MVTTQAFADLCGTTKKTIIYYDRIGLLKPASRRKSLHLYFRLYHPRQVLTFQKIALLKSFGLSLKEIKKCLHSGKDLKKLFSDKRSQLEEQKESLERRIAKIDEFVGNLRKGKPMVVPQIKTVEPYVIYGVEKTGRYVDIDCYQREVFKLVGKKFFCQPGITVFREPYFTPAKAHMLTGVVAKGQKLEQIKGVKTVQVPAHKTVFYAHVGPYSYLSYIWEFLNKYVKENNLKRHPKLNDRELYIVGRLKEENEDNFVTELQIPIL